MIKYLKTMIDVILNFLSYILTIKIENYSIVIAFGPLLLTIGLIIAIIWIWRHGLHFFKKYDIVEGKIPIPAIGTVTIRPNHETVKIAHSAWIELVTRKAALTFDESHDVIVEIYNSWYQLFGHLRELAKEIPSHKLRKDKESQKLVKVMVEVLNEGLRPHLTEWQAKFRRWYNYELEESSNKNLSPQEIQRKFPEYESLIDGIKEVNKIIIAYASLLKKIVKFEENN